MVSLFKYIGLIILSIMTSELLSVLFFSLRFLSDKNAIPVGWVIIVPFLIASISGLIIFFVGKLIKVGKPREIGIVICVLWLLYLYSSQILGK